uniref:cyclic pyranopterin monophosphate synthase n=1 Tax=Anthurium amnicola TaxID=1678845 RepID=A0A1D1XW57_9ARAE
MFLRQARSNFSSFRRHLCSRSSTDAAIAELNKEMEVVFGTPLFSDNVSSQAVQESQFFPPTSSQSEQGLTHVTSSGEARMVDISTKKDSKRVARASCKVLLGQKVFDLVAANQIAKGDVLNVAKIAGISGAKQTSNLIPLCHNINLTHVNVDLNLNNEDCSVDVQGEAATTGRTGVEMEAMTAVTVAGLTIYDMCKAASKDIQITDIRLDSKTGGRSGEWSRKR